MKTKKILFQRWKLFADEEARRRSILEKQNKMDILESSSIECVTTSPNCSVISLMKTSSSKRKIVDSNNNQQKKVGIIIDSDIVIPKNVTDDIELEGIEVEGDELEVQVDQQVDLNYLLNVFQVMLTNQRVVIFVGRFQVIIIAAHWCLDQIFFYS